MCEFSSALIAFLIIPAQGLRIGDIL